ncbi:Ankyrin repeat and SOCS box protein 15 [Myotis brandtii]|uniref:Ankyrin repeat and SOCS box protein 15 n=1 Tax=Myotis brandtii TaxID=109478 RepID=S7NK21_MYOBR|nr:Ankyrin repeat and SOCS box protein 15 [Myotis brandtii]
MAAPTAERAQPSGKLVQTRSIHHRGRHSVTLETAWLLPLRTANDACAWFSDAKTLERQDSFHVFEDDVFMERRMCEHERTDPDETLGDPQQKYSLLKGQRRLRFVPLSDQNRKLVKAIKHGHILELQEYVKYKYALDEADEKGWFPLHEAVVQPIQQILEIVLDASYKTLWEFKTADGETPLTLAVKAGLVENVRTLLEKGVWPNTKNDKGETPLLIGK